VFVDRESGIELLGPVAHGLGFNGNLCTETDTYWDPTITYIKPRVTRTLEQTPEVLDDRANTVRIIETVTRLGRILFGSSGG
jgi:hypothetical protein